MKIARLPDGSMMEFPPDFPDDEMDRAVRQKLGVAEPVDPTQMVAELVAQTTQQSAALAQAIGEMRSAQQQTDQAVMGALDQIAQALNGLTQAHGQTLQLLAEGFGRMEKAALAPRSIVTGPNGQVLGMRIGDNTNGA